MEMIILGCAGSAGVPMLGGPDGAGDWGECDPNEPRNRRTRSSVIISDGPGRVLLVDTGPDLRDQLLAQRVGVVDAVRTPMPMPTISRGWMNCGPSTASSAARCRFTARGR